LRSGFARVDREKLAVARALHEGGNFVCKTL
jgi:hypothetical protein